MRVPIRSVPILFSSDFVQICGDTVGDLHCLEFRVHFLEVDRLGHLASVMTSDIVGNVRTHSGPGLPFGDFIPCFVLTSVSTHGL